MSGNISEPHTISWREKEKHFTGIYIPVDAKMMHARTFLIDIERSFLCIHTDGTASKWSINGITERNNKLYLYGESIDAMLLTQLKTPISYEKAEPILSAVMAAVERFWKASVYNLSYNYILIGSENEVYLPSPSLNNAVRRLLPPDAMQNNSHYLTLAKKEPLSALIILLARRFFIGKQQDILRPPLLYNDGLSMELSNILDIFRHSRLSGPHDTMDGLSRAMRTPDSHVPDKVIFQQERQYRKRLRRVKWTAHRRYIIITAAIGMFAALLFFTTKKPEMPIMNPELTVRTFYTSINTLNHSRMSEITRNNAGSDIINEVIQIFVSSRMQYAMERKSVIVTPDQYTNEDDVLVYGISHLNIVPAYTDINTMQFIVHYEKWMPALNRNTRDTRNTAPRHAHHAVQEIVTLEQYNNRWYITAVEEKNNY